MSGWWHGGPPRPPDLATWGVEVAAALEEPPGDGVAAAPEAAAEGPPDTVRATDTHWVIHHRGHHVPEGAGTYGPGPPVWDS